MYYVQGKIYMPKLNWLKQLYSYCVVKRLDEHLLYEILLLSHTTITANVWRNKLLLLLENNFLEYQSNSNLMWEWYIVKRMFGQLIFGNPTIRSFHSPQIKTRDFCWGSDWCVCMSSSHLNLNNILQYQ